MGTMSNFLELLAPSDESPRGATFVPVARFYPAMDFLLYLAEDVSYRADRVDEILTVLWHPYEERLVGIKLKGFACLVQEVKRALGNQDISVMPLVTLVAEALMQGGAQKLIAEHEQPRRDAMRRKYLLAVDFARKAPPVSADDLQRVAA